MYVSVYLTASSEHEAKGIVKKLLKQKLIACANLFPISSLYFWNEKLQEEAEIAIIMKTRAGLVEKLTNEIKKIHSYDVPCIVSWDIIKGSKEYLSWIKSETIEPEADNLPDTKRNDK